MTNLRQWAAELRAEQRRRMPHAGQASSSTELVLAWANVVSVSSSGVVIDLSPYGEPDSSSLRLDGWLTTVDPSLTASPFVQIGGPRLAAGDTALVMLYAGYLLALGKRGTFVRREPADEDAAGRVFIVVTPTRTGGVLRWNYVPAPGSSLRVAAWELILDLPDGAVSNISAGTSTTRTVGGLEGGDVVTATVIGTDSDGEVLGTASVTWEVEGEGATPPPQAAVSCRADGENDINVSYSASGTLIAWRFYVDDAQRASGTSAASRTFSHSGLDADSQHTYRIEADYWHPNERDSSRERRTVTASDTCTTGETPVPEIVSFAGVADLNVIALTWQTMNCDSLVLQRAPEGSTAFVTIHTPAADERDMGSHTDTIELDPGDEESFTYRLVCGTVTAEASVTASLPEEIPLPTVTITDATATSPTTATVEWETTGGELTGQTVTVTPTGDPAGAFTLTPGTEDRSVTLTGLTPGATYTVTVTVTNEAGSAASAGATFTTSAVGVPFALDCDGQTTSSFRVDWRYAGTATFEVRIREQGTAAWGSWVPVSVRLHTFTGLDAATSYEVEVRAVVGGNRSTAVPIVCDTTG
ncbi:MAG: fibronectin type III domain-containing protein, partial [Rhodococcus sp.]|nr:fibronectin type III domain-containing protein [Rhodococcus sp. (in: high G+C Gram-positive bacteria)]